MMRENNKGRKIVPIVVALILFTTLLFFTSISGTRSHSFVGAPGTFEVTASPDTLNVNPGEDLELGIYVDFAEPHPGDYPGVTLSYSEPYGVKVINVDNSIEFEDGTIVLSVHMENIGSEAVIPGQTYSLLVGVRNHWWSDSVEFTFNVMETIEPFDFAFQAFDTESHTISHAEVVQGQTNGVFLCRLRIDRTQGAMEKITLSTVGVPDGAIVYFFDGVKITEVIEPTVQYYQTELWVTTGKDVQPGVYPITIKADSNTKTKTIAFSLEIIGGVFDFNLIVEKTHPNETLFYAYPGGTTSLELALQTTSDSTVSQPISLSASTPYKISTTISPRIIELSPNTVTYAQVVVGVDSSIGGGEYPISFKAQSGDLEKFGSATIKVVEKPTPIVEAYINNMPVSSAMRTLETTTPVTLTVEVKEGVSFVSYVYATWNDGLLGYQEGRQTLAKVDKDTHKAILPIEPNNHKLTGYMKLTNGETLQIFDVMIVVEGETGASWLIWLFLLIGISLTVIIIFVAIRSRK